MSSNSSSQAQSSSGSSDDTVEFILAILALVISVLAFVIATLQALNQYFASATGFSNCSEEVIGKWSAFRVRRMRWSEFRFTVSFETPVIFVAPPENKRGPLGTSDQVRIMVIDGGPSNHNVISSPQEVAGEQEKALTEQSRFQAVHTADNERASWVDLLTAIHRMESESRSWQKQILGYNASPYDEPPHSIAVCMQRKKRSWDTMPSDITKPYAQTTISHLVEFTAMLGIYWKEFDMIKNKYRAQGNGFIVIGSYLEHLGVAFTFQKQGSTWFQNNRVVPNTIIKELCFGLSPTIFPRGRKVYADEPKDISTLQLGSFDDIAETLVELGCNNNTVNYFKGTPNQARLSHLFPIAFELLGMVGQVIHVEHTVFRMLPNPTAFYWNPAAFSIRTLTADFVAVLQERCDADPTLASSPQVQMVVHWARENNELLVQPAQSSIELEKDGDASYLLDEIAALRAGLKDCDSFLMKKEIAHLVKPVVRVHVQEVLKMLNRHTDDSGDITMDSIDSATSDLKHRLLAEAYLSSLRKNVIGKVCAQLKLAQQLRSTRLYNDSTGTPGNTDAAATRSYEVEINNIWCTLVFRMLLWLRLHEFHKKDIQIAKSDAFGSRMPVYII